ncbi:MAG: hypothetical protein U9O18_05640 [Chloroflexota bacterium]|nr:hypothetical protein [Chloroflexota bacterium]
MRSRASTAATPGSNNDIHRFGDFGLLGPGQIPSVAGNQSLTIDGIEVYVDDTHITGPCANTFVEAHLSWDGGSSWSSPNPGTANDSGYLNGAPQDFALGSATDLRAFDRTWSRSNFADGSFEVRLRARKGGTCPGAQLRVDQLRIQVHYTLTTSVFIPDANIDDPYGQPLAPQGLWGTFINQGAHKINGDAFLPKWDPRTSGTNDEYDPETYYNYALEIPAGANNGELWIYDPVFCGTNVNGRYGTGDRWFGSTNQTSAFYTLYDTMNTPYVFADDVVVGQSGSLFKNIRASDESLNGPDLGPSGASTDCSVGATANQNDGRYWHNRWWPMSSGLAGGKTYRLHTRSTDPDNAAAMDQANGHNSFALWSQATGGTPRIYGLGAMQAFTPLNGGGAATFYLAQIDAEHAGKTMVIKLWDPGDTGNLTADLKILKPTASAYAETTFSYSAERVASGASYCSGEHGSSVSSVRTNTGGYKVFNGCWLTIEIPLPVDYTAPRPATEDPSVEGGWWKIRYDMGGSSSDAAFDLTTWQVELRGNPVHLVLE